MQLFHVRLEENTMMYPYITLNDGTEITHSEILPDGQVKVYIETPDEKVCFRHATCWLPKYKWEDVLENGKLPSFFINYMQYLF